MAVLTGILVILVFYVLAVFGVIVGSVLLLARISGPKRPRRQRPPVAPKPPVTQTRPPARVKARPAPKPPARKTSPPAPQYIPRWGLHRHYSEAAEKARWKEEFNRLLQ